MLDDQAIFEPEDVESDAWSEEVVLRVGEDIIAIFKDADRIDGRIGGKFLMRAATPAGPGPTCRLCWMYLFGLTMRTEPDLWSQATSGDR